MTAYDEIDLRRAAEAGIRAPSLHNSQPWLFRIGPSVIDVYADRNRRLPVLDPDGRELLCSVTMTGKGRTAAAQPPVSPWGVPTGEYPRRLSSSQIESRRSS